MSLKRIWKPEDKLKVLQEVEEGIKIVEVCRKYQIAPQDVLSARGGFTFGG